MNTPTSPAAEKLRRHGWRWLKFSLLALLLLLPLLLFVLGRESVLQALVARINGQQGLILSQVSGSLYGPLKIGKLSWRNPQQALEMEQLELDWQPRALLRGQVHITQLKAGKLEFSQFAPSKEPLTLPASLELPFNLSLSLPQVQLGALSYQQKGQEWRFHNLALHLQYQNQNWNLQNASLDSEWGALQAQLQVGAAKPFPLQGQLALRADGAQAKLKLDGSLEQARLDGNFSNEVGDKASVQAQILPFAAELLHSLQLQAQGVNPARIQAAWPQADLQLAVQLQTGTDKKLHGKLQLENRKPAALDAQGLPLSLLQAQVDGDLVQHMELSQILLQLGSTAGGGSSNGGKISGQTRLVWQELAKTRLDLVLQDINLQALHSKLKPTRIAGKAQITQGDTLQAQLHQAGLEFGLQARWQKDSILLQQVSLRAQQASLDLQGKLDLNGARAFALEGKLAHFDPAKWGKFPAADVSANIHLQGQAKEDWQVASRIELLPGHFANKALRGKLQLQADARQIHDLDLNLEWGTNRLRATGALALQGGKQELRWDLAWSDWQALPWSNLPQQGQFKASGVLQGSLQNAATTLQLQAQDVRWDAGQGGLGLKLAGKLNLFAPFHTRLEGEVQHVNPAQWRKLLAQPALPEADVNATLSLQGQLDKADVSLTLRNSQWQKHAASGELQAQFSNRSLLLRKLRLQVGDNQFQGEGSLGSAREVLRWKLSAPALQQLHAQAGGRAQAEGQLAAGWSGGNPALHQLQIQFQGEQLAWGTEQSVRAVQAGIDYQPERMQAQVSARELQAGKFQLPFAQITLGGSLARHDLSVQLKHEKFHLHSAVQASLRQQKDGWEWLATLQQLRNEGQYPLRLAANTGPAQLALVVRQGNLEKLRLQQLVLALQGGQLTLQNLEKQGAAWRSEGQFSRLPLQFLWPQMPEEMQSDLLLGGQWTLELGRSAQGRLRFAREAGDLRLLAGSGAQTLGLSQLLAEVSLQQGQVNFSAELDSKQAGRIVAGGSTRISQQNGVWGLAASAPLGLQLDANLRSLAWFAPLSGIPDLELGGQLQARATASGSVGAPQLSGELQAGQLALRWPGLGLRLKNGEVKAKLGQDQLQLQRLYWEGEQGDLQGSGHLRFADKALQGQMGIKAQGLQVLGRPDRQLRLSGTLDMKLEQKQIKLSGNLSADSARIDIGGNFSSGGVVLSDDVVVVGGPPRAARNASLPLVLDLGLDLGEDFQLRGNGVQAQLEGSLRLKALDRRGLRGNGSISVREGSYSAYGQKLSIERGILNFAGAIDNPAINLLAVRKIPDQENGVEAGIELRGTLQAPQARLVSTPSVPDSEKLSWLILGHGSEGMDDKSDKDSQLLGLAAKALLGGSGGNKLANALALDEISLGRAKGVETAVLAVGKRLSSKAYLSFEQGSGSASTLLKLRYALNQRLSLQVQTGNNNAVDAFYTWRFD